MGPGVGSAGALVAVIRAARAIENAVTLKTWWSTSTAATARRQKHVQDAIVAASVILILISWIALNDMYVGTCGMRRSASQQTRGLSLVCWLVRWLAGWLASWRAGWLAACLAGWLAGWVGGWLACWPAGWLAVWLVGQLARWWTASKQQKPFILRPQLLTSFVKHA